MGIIGDEAIDLSLSVKPSLAMFCIASVVCYTILCVVERKKSPKSNA